MMAFLNQLKLTASLKEVPHLRYTPSGLPCVEFCLVHQSDQLESKMMRKVECEIDCIAFDTLAQEISTYQPKRTYDWLGFLAAKSAKYPKLIFHIQAIRPNEVI